MGKPDVSPLLIAMGRPLAALAFGEVDRAVLATAADVPRQATRMTAEIRGVLLGVLAA